MKYIVSLCILIMLYGCANIVPLTGGKKDDKVPRLLTSNLVSTNFKANHIKLEFDEYIATANGIDLITIQPKHTTFNVTGNNKTIRIDFDSSLHPNTTYILNIEKGVNDLNEANPYSLSYIFSTGPQLDTNFVSYKVINYSNYKYLKIGLSLTSVDSVQKLKFDYLYPLNQETTLIKGLTKIKYNCWIFTDKNADNIPDEYMPIYYDTITLNAKKEIKLNNWVDVRNSKLTRYAKYTKIFKQVNELGTYNQSEVIYLDQDSSLFVENNNDTLAQLDLSRELSSKINSRIQCIKNNNEYLLIIDKCGISNIKISDNIKYREDNNFFYINSKTIIDSINFNITNNNEIILFNSKIKKVEAINKLSTLKISKTEHYKIAIITIFENGKMIINKKIQLKNDQIFYLNPDKYKIIIYNTDSYENISFNLNKLNRINCKIIETEIILKPNWDEVLQVIF